MNSWKIGFVHSKQFCLFALFFCFISSSNILMAESIEDEKAINTDLVKVADVTGNGTPDKITVHLSAKNMKSPFLWTITIISEGKQVYSHSSNDTQLDRFFNDDGYVDGCKDYISCKSKYYYHDILDGLILTGNKWYDVNSILDPSKTNTLYSLGRKELRKCCKVTGRQADSILRKIEHKFRVGKAIAINVPQSPVQSNPPLIYVPEVRRFIRFYEE